MLYRGEQQVLGQRLRSHFSNHQIPVVFKHAGEGKCTISLKKKQTIAPRRRANQSSYWYSLMLLFCTSSSLSSEVAGFSIPLLWPSTAVMTCISSGELCSSPPSTTPIWARPPLSRSRMSWANKTAWKTGKSRQAVLCLLFLQYKNEKYDNSVNTFKIKYIILNECVLSFFFHFTMPCL